MGEGGATVLNHPELVERAEIIREKGTDRSRFYRGQVDKYTWVDIGSSFLPSELNAAYLLAQLDAGADTNPFQQSLTEGEPNVTYGMVKFTGDLTQVYFDYFIPRDVHETESGGTACVMDTETYLVIDYLPDNGPIVDLSIHDENYPAGEDLDTVTQNFIAQLNTTIPGQWQQTTTPEDDPTYQRYIYAHDSGVLRVTSHHIHQQDFSLTVMLEPEVYGSLYPLNNLAHDPYGQTYTAPL